MLLCSKNLGAQCWVEASNHTYMVFFDFTILQVNPVQASCTTGYDFTVDIQYAITSSGNYKAGNIHSIDTELNCYGAIAPNNTSFPLPTDTASGLTVTSSLSTNSTNCASDTPVSLLCNQVIITAIGKMFATYDQICLPGFALFTELYSTDIRSTEMGDITFEWTTAVERDTKSYLVEHLYEGDEFELLEEVQAQGNSEVKTDYAVTLPLAKSGVHYFKLMEVDLNGDTTFLKLMSYKLKEKDEVVLFPNPSVDGKFILEGKAVEQQNYKVFNAQGQIISPDKYLQSMGENRVIFDLSNLPKGVYHLRSSEMKDYSLVVV